MIKAFKVIVMTIGVFLITAGHSQANTVVYGKVELFQTATSFTDRFEISVAGRYVATLTDFESPAPMIDTGMSVATGTELLGSLLVPGSFTFDATPGEYFVSFFGTADASTSSQLGRYGIEISQVLGVDLSGTIKTVDGTDICAMVLASGQSMFSCNPVGVFSLTGLPSENDGTVKRQIYADGFFPKVDILEGSSDDAVVMMHLGACPDYNTPYDPVFAPDSTGKRIDISGSVLLQNSQTPICAIVLANGQYMFTCDDSGSYALNIPLDTNGQFKLQVYADGFAPKIQTFDEFQAVNDVRMAHAVECQ